MFERFTDQARRVVVLAMEEARRLNHSQIGTEHLLLGLLREPASLATEVLGSLAVSVEEVRVGVEETIGRGRTAPPDGRMLFTPGAKRALELSLREAEKLRHHSVGTEHLLLGLLCEAKGVAAQVLVGLGADHARVREQVRALLPGGSGEAAEAAARARLVRLSVPEDLASSRSRSPRCGGRRRPRSTRRTSRPPRRCATANRRCWSGRPGARGHERPAWTIRW